MAYESCPDCGERVYNLGCTNCNETAYIEEQERLNDLYGEIDRQYARELDEFFADTFGSKSVNHS